VTKYEQAGKTVLAKHRTSPVMIQKAKVLLAQKQKEHSFGTCMYNRKGRDFKKQSNLSMYIGSITNYTYTLQTLDHTY